MTSTPAPSRVESSGQISFHLRRMITHRIDLLDVSSRLGITLSTLRKILAGGPISPFIEKKVREALARGGRPAPSGRNRSDIERLLQVHRLYEQWRTLRGVADRIGLSRERVRQLLVKGSEFGLFEYRPSPEIFLPREKIVADYRRFLTLKGIAAANQISILRLKRLLAIHRIADSELREIRVRAKKSACSEAYDEVVRGLGFHPTTTELQRTFSKHYLTTQIRRLWGSIDAFRRDRGIPKPARAFLPEGHSAPHVFLDRPV